MDTAKNQQNFSGRDFTVEEISLIQEVVETCTGISRTELAYTVCELLDWKRAGGGLKGPECRELLERLESQGVLALPAKKSLGSIQSKKSISPGGEGQFHSELTGSVEAFAPIEVELVQSREERQVFRELLSRYHYLGYAMPYGAPSQQPRWDAGRVLAYW